MTDFVLNNSDGALPQVVSQATHDFAAALAATPQFQAFEDAARELDQDAVAQRAVADYQAKQQSLQALLMLNAVSPADRAEMNRLYRACADRPAVQTYMRSEADVTALCQEVGDLLSRRIGFDFAAACASGGCC